MSGRRRVLFVAPAAYPLGGVATWLDYLLPGLRSAGWQPVLGLASGEHHDVGAYLAAHRGLEVEAISNPTGSAEGRILATAACIEQVKADVVLGVNIVHTYPAVARAREVGGRDVRSAMTLHGIQPDLFGDCVRFGDVLDAVVCTNRLTAALVARCGFDAERIHYAPYGIALPATAGARASPGHAIRIAVVGRLEQWQKRVMDVPAIMDALVARGVAAELLVAGAGPEEPRLRDALADHSAAGRVHFLGVLDEAQLADRVYRQADVLLVTSAWETGPIVAWEAMAHGVPVVSSRYVGSGLESALHDGGNALLFPVGDVAAAAACLARIREPRMHADLVRGGLDLVRSRYSRERSVEAWDAALRAILAAPPVGGHGAVFGEPPAGRLDRIVGPRRAEALRRLAGRRHRHAAPGGEWPHTLTAQAPDDPQFWIEAAHVDGGRP